MPKKSLKRRSKKKNVKSTRKSVRRVYRMKGMKPAPVFDMNCAIAEIEAVQRARKAHRSARSRKAVSSPRKPFEQLGMGRVKKSMKKTRKYRMTMMNKDIFKKLLKQYREYNDSWFSSDKDKLSKVEIDLMINWVISELKKDNSDFKIDMSMFDFFEKNMTYELLKVLHSLPEERKDFGSRWDDLKYVTENFDKVIKKGLKQFNKTGIQLSEERLKELLNRTS